jgi:hypothetical protein
MKAGLLSMTLKQNTRAKNGTPKRATSKESKKEQIKNQINVYLFSDHTAVLQKKFVPQGQTINQTFY